MLLWILLAIVVLLVVVLVLFYNRLVRLRNRVENAWAQVDVQLKRRYDLIPNLVETVKGYAAHERGTFEAVTNARTRAQAAQGPAEQGAAEGILSQALGRLFAVAEAYPELQADENFRQLQDELANTENRIAVSRQVYNDTVLTYNNAIQTVPGVLLAGPLGFTGDAAAKFFTLPDANVVVQIEDDGTLAVDELITFSFSGEFSGAFREIPLRDGETITDVAVSEGDVEYAPGA